MKNLIDKMKNLISLSDVVQGLTYMFILVAIMIALGGVTGYCDTFIKIIDGVKNSLGSLSTNLQGAMLVYFALSLFFFLVAYVTIKTAEKFLTIIFIIGFTVLSIYDVVDLIANCNKDDGILIGFFKLTCSIAKSL